MQHIKGSESFNDVQISVRTTGVAVAVNAIIGILNGYTHNLVTEILIK